MEQFYKKVILLVLLLFIVCACGNEVPRNTIPYAQVNFRIDINGLDYELKEPLAYKIFTEGRIASDKIGYGGLLIVSDLTGNSLFAYDLCCPYEDNKDIKVKPQSDGTAKCQTCGSVFSTLYGLGTPESGPSEEPLQRYNVVHQQYGVFQVFN